MAADQREAVAVHARIAAVCERFLRCGLPLLGWVSQDARVGAAIRRRTPVLLEHARCQASRDLRALSVALAAAVAPAATSAKPGRGLSGWLSKLVLRGS
jgi:MinD-like ATPase involved in chromosome partitioning or flagellar assembly